MTYGLIYRKGMTLKMRKKKKTKSSKQRQLKSNKKEKRCLDQMKLKYSPRYIFAYHQELPTHPFLPRLICPWSTIVIKPRNP